MQPDQVTVKYSGFQFESRRTSIRLLRGAANATPDPASKAIITKRILNFFIGDK